MASGGDGSRDSMTRSLGDQSASPSPSPQASMNQNRRQSIHTIPTTSDSIPTQNLFFDPFERQEVPVPPTFVHPSTVPVRPAPPIRSVTAPTKGGPIFGPPQLQNGPSKAYEMSTQVPSRLPTLREQPTPANPPSPPALNIPSPTPSVHSTKTETHTPLPPRSVLLKLVEIYFTHVNNQTYGFLHRPTFLRHIEEGKVPDGLLYSICAISARFSASHAPPPLPRQSSKETPAYHAGEPYAIEGRKLALRDFDKPTVQNVQTLLLLALHDFGGKKGQKAWMFAGMAIRMASALRLNREVDGDPIGAESVTPVEEAQITYGVPEGRPPSKEKVSWTEREVRRRTFWACFVMDVSPTFVCSNFSD
jgi:Fungal specific transcription factor domain